MSGLSRNLRTLDRQFRRENARKEPIGQGDILRNCDECGSQFRTNDTYKVLCDPCEGEGQPTNEDPTEHQGSSYRFERFRRGGFR